MQYYQKDFLREPLPIAEKSVKLFISSPPLKILSDELVLMFGRITQYMRADGWIFIDTLAGYREAVSLYHVGQASKWLMGGGFFVPQMWNGEDHYIHGFRRYREGFPDEMPGPLRKDDTVPSHFCEFNPGMMSQLIDFYSEPGDTVMDGFCGTGTVMKVAEKMGRIGIGVDLRPKENVYGTLE